MPKQTKTCFSDDYVCYQIDQFGKLTPWWQLFEDQLTQPDLLENQKKTFCRNQDKLNQTLGSFDWQTLKTEIFRSKLTSQLEIVRSFIMEREKTFFTTYTNGYETPQKVSEKKHHWFPYMVWV